MKSLSHHNLLHSLMDEGSNFTSMSMGDGCKNKTVVHGIGRKDSRGNQVGGVGNLAYGYMAELGKSLN